MCTLFSSRAQLISRMWKDYKFKVHFCQMESSKRCLEQTKENLLPVLQTGLQMGNTKHETVVSKMRPEASVWDLGSGRRDPSQEWSKVAPASLSFLFVIPIFLVLFNGWFLFLSSDEWVIKSVIQMKPPGVQVGTPLVTVVLLQGPKGRAGKVRESRERAFRAVIGEKTEL